MTAVLKGVPAVEGTYCCTAAPAPRSTQHGKLQREQGAVLDVTQAGVLCQDVSRCTSNTKLASIVPPGQQSTVWQQAGAATSCRTRPQTALELTRFRLPKRALDVRLPWAASRPANPARLTEEGESVDGSLPRRPIRPGCTCRPPLWRGMCPAMAARRTC